jgi:TonB family protein
MPAGPGYGNGSGGSRGVRGTIRSAGFGNGIASAGSAGSQGRTDVRESGFGDLNASTRTTEKKPRAAIKSELQPVEILFKPNPIYTEEGRRLRVQGEVLVEVVFSASGELRVLRVTQGLGHGLDEAALRAAEQIRFKPASRGGQPIDSTATLHIVFQLAYEHCYRHTQLRTQRVT